MRSPEEAVFSQRTVERSRHHARLNLGELSIGVDAHDRMHVSLHVDHQAVREALTVRSRSTSPSRDGEGLGSLCVVSKKLCDLYRGRGDGHSGRFDLVDRVVGGIHRSGRKVAADRCPAAYLEWTINHVFVARAREPSECRLPTRGAARRSWPCVRRSCERWGPAPRSLPQRGQWRRG